MKFKWITLFLISVITLSLLLLPPSSLRSQPRDPQKVYKVAILPFLIHSQENLDYLREGIYDILASRMTVEGRIVVVERSQWNGPSTKRGRCASMRPSPPGSG